MLATELPSLRPRFRVLSVDPADLAAAIAEFRPLLVICSRMSDAIRNSTIGAIVLYPNGEDHALVEAAGHVQLLSSPRLADLLAAIDTIMDPAPTES